MSYETMEAGLQSLLQGIDGFEVDRTNVRLADYEKVNVGIIKMLVLHFGGLRHERRSFQGIHLHHWTINCDLLVRWRNDTQARNGLRDNIQAVVDRIDEYPKLNNTAGCWIAEVTSVATEASRVEVGGIHFMSQQITIEVAEEVTVSEQE